MSDKGSSCVISNQANYQSISQSVNHACNYQSMNQQSESASIVEPNDCHSIDLSISQSINESIDQSINGSVDQSISRSVSDSSSFLRDTLKYAINLLKQTDDERLIIDQIKSTKNQTTVSQSVNENQSTNIPPLSEAFEQAGLLDERELLTHKQSNLSVNPPINGSISRGNQLKHTTGSRFPVLKHALTKSVDESKKLSITRLSSSPPKKTSKHSSPQISLSNVVQLPASSFMRRTASLPALTTTTKASQSNHKSINQSQRSQSIQTRSITAASLERLAAPRVRSSKHGQPVVKPSEQIPASVLSTDQSIKRSLKPVVRFTFRPSTLIALRGDRFNQSVDSSDSELEDNDDRVESLEFLRLSKDGDLESTVVSVILRDQSLDQSVVSIDASSLVSDLECNFCVQLWSHSREVDSVIDGDEGPKHELVSQYIGSVLDITRACQSISQSRDQSETIAFHQLFLAVDVVLQETNSKDNKSIDLSSHQPSKPTGTLGKPRSDSISSLHSRKLSISQLSALSSNSNDSEVGCLVDLITPEPVFIRRQKLQITQATRRHNRATSETELGMSRFRLGSVDFSTDELIDLSMTRASTEFIDDLKSPPLFSSSLFTPRYYRVTLSMVGLPNMKFDGFTDAYFEVLLVNDTARSSLYRSEVQFDSVHPRFVPFVLSSVRDSDLARTVVVRVLHWRHSASTEEVIGECSLKLRELVPQITTGTIPSITFEISNQVRASLRMKNVRAGTLHLAFTSLSASPVSVDTAPCTWLKSDRQLMKRNEHLQQVEC